MTRMQWFICRRSRPVKETEQTMASKRTSNEEPQLRLSQLQLPNPEKLSEVTSQRKVAKKATKKAAKKTGKKVGKKKATRR
jgi:hypothetical protein